MMRCTCCGQWTVEAVTLDRGSDKGGVITFYRVNRRGRLWDEYTTLAAVTGALIEQGIFDNLVEVDD